MSKKSRNAPANIRNLDEPADAKAAMDRIARLPGKKGISYKAADKGQATGAELTAKKKETRKYSSDTEISGAPTGASIKRVDDIKRSRDEDDDDQTITGMHLEFVRVEFDRDMARLETKLSGEIHDSEMKLSGEIHDSVKHLPWWVIGAAGTSVVAIVGILVLFFATKEYTNEQIKNARESIESSNERVVKAAVDKRTNMNIGSFDGDNTEKSSNNPPSGGNNTPRNMQNGK